MNTSKDTSSTPDNTLAKSLSTLRILWFAFLGSIVSFSYLILVEVAPAGAEPVLPAVEWAFFAMGLVAVGLALLLPRLLARLAERDIQRNLSAGKSVPALDRVTRAVQIPFVVRLAFGEMPIVLGVALRALGDSSSGPWLFACVSLALHLACFPSQMFWESRLRVLRIGTDRSGSER
jgi:hypothetical protein